MSASSLLETIQTHPFLRDLPEKHLVTMAGFAMLTRFEPGKIIFRQNDTANRFYLLVSGTVQLGLFGADQEVLIEKIGAGETLGWSWMFEPHLWQFDARAEGAGEAIFFYATPLLAMCDQDREMGYDLMKWSASIMLQRLQTVRSRLVELESRAK